jgi:hypothetical protein
LKAKNAKSRAESYNVKVKAKSKKLKAKNAKLDSTRYLNNLFAPPL